MNENYRKFNSGRFGTEVSPVEIEHETKIAGSKGVTNSTGKKGGQGKDRAGNTYKDQATADEFDSQGSSMSGGFMSKVMGMFGGG